MVRANRDVNDGCNVSDSDDSDGVGDDDIDDETSGDDHARDNIDNHTDLNDGDGDQHLHHGPRQ